MPSASSHSFRRHIWPLLLRYKWHLILAFALNGQHGDLVAQPGLFQDLVHGQTLRE